MKAHFYKEERDYPFFEEWCNDYGIVARHPSQLPPLGLVIDYQGKPAAMLFAYQSAGCGVAFVECFICRKELSPIMKFRMSVLLLKLITGRLEKDDYGMIRSCIVDPRMARIAARKCGFIEVESATMMERSTEWA